MDYQLVWNTIWRKGCEL